MLILTHMAEGWLLQVHAMQVIWQELALYCDTFHDTSDQPAAADGD